MGKMKRVKQKLHAAAVRSKIKNSNVGDENGMDVTEVVAVDPTAGGKRGESLFQNVRISSADLSKQKLPDFDAQSTITSRMFKGQNMKKKDKLKIRQEMWTTKIDLIQSAKRKAKESKRKQKTPIVGDLTPIEDALPTLELLMRESSEDSARRNRETTEKPRSIPKEKKRKEQMMKDISLFQQVLQHPVFQENASAAIKEHLKMKLQTEGKPSNVDKTKGKL
uniref:Ribosome biogenesis protein SLX9 n=1 Tax=Arion vulgaris TaxID=1028688 RepID=A0A0B6Z057_9EUPU